MDSSLQHLCETVPLSYMHFTSWDQKHQQAKTQLPEPMSALSSHWWQSKNPSVNLGTTLFNRAFIREGR